MTKFEIGITQSEPSWQQILGQERVNFRLWDKTFSEETPKVMVVNHDLTDDEVGAFRAYVETGNAVLTNFVNLAKLDPSFKYDKLEVIHYIEPAQHSVFDGIALIDLEAPGWCSNQANTGRLDNQGAALYCGQLGHGHIIALPFDVSSVLRDNGRVLKAFYFESAEFPYEEVAVAAQHAVRRLCVNCLRQLTRQVGLPYVHLWYYPEFKRTAFTFRVDGDTASREEVEKTVQLAVKHGLKFSWYVNAKSHRSLMGYYAELARQGHDVQLHCYEHKVFDDVERNLQNLRAGLEIMNEAGLKPVGFVGPYGHWNAALNQALEQTGIKYSSEFGRAYDDFPFYPILEGGLAKVLQIPVHPMCFGRLLQAHLKHDALLSYYKDYFRLRYAGGETLFLYDHPHRIAQNFDTYDAIFKMVGKASDVWQTTLSDFAKWWTTRNDIEFDVWGEKGIITVEAEYDPSVAIHVIEDEREALIPMMSKEFEADDLSWHAVKRTYPFKPEMLKTRKLGRHLWLREQMWKAGRLLKH
jgi:peptidoglycan/xylan/chitin deacetylase (PgdA/CDA1 family)